MQAGQYYTAEMVRNLPDDGNRYETVYGELLVSPSTARHDRFTKRRLYQEIGADEYWVVDHDSGAVEVWEPDAHFPGVETRSVTWTAPGATEPLILDLATLLRE